MRALTPFVLLVFLPGVRPAEKPQPLPIAARDWKIELTARAPTILHPTAITVAPDGAIYIGQDPRDMGGPVDKPIDSIVCLRAGKPTLYADKLYSVMGLEYLDGALYVVHPPFLSAFRDTDGDGKADVREDLVTGLGPDNPAFSGINDHVASGLRFAMDGFLYISVGDKGIPKATDKDGTSISLFGGGVVRVRPDGSNLEVVATGLRNPLSVALNADDDLFTYGNDDDSKQWPNAVVHIIDGGHYGYPYEFVHHPERRLPWLTGELGGSGTQGMCYVDDGLAAKFAGNLFFTDWGQRKLFRYEIEPAGGTYKLGKRSELVTPGKLDDFRPFSIHADATGASLYLVDWGFNGWLQAGVQSGRLYRLTYHGADKRTPAPRGSNDDPIDKQIAALAHPSHRERLRAQRALVRADNKAVDALLTLLASNKEAVPRRHALWALDRIGGDKPRKALRAALSDHDANLRKHAARSAGIRKDLAALPALVKLLKDGGADVRRDSAIALGRLGNKAAVPALLAALDEPDPFVAWSVRTALRRINAWDADELVAAYRDQPGIRVPLLLTLDEVWSPAVVHALGKLLHLSKEPAARARMAGLLAGLYRKYPPWSGYWFGTNPLIGSFPEKTEAWDADAMKEIVQLLGGLLDDQVAVVRNAAVNGLAGVGKPAIPLLIKHLESEKNLDNRLAVIAVLGRSGAPAAIGVLAKSLDKKADARESAASIRALADIGGNDAIKHLRAELRQLVAASSDDSPRLPVLLAQLARRKQLEPAELACALRSRTPAARAAGLRALADIGRADDALKQRVGDLLDDPDDGVKSAAIAATRALRLQATAPLIKLADHAKLGFDARQALADMPDPAALDILVQGLTDPDWFQRRACIQALVKLRPRVANRLAGLAEMGKIQASALPDVDRILARTKPMRAWKTLGPLPRTSPNLFPDHVPADFKKTYPGADGKPIAWQQALKVNAHSGRVDLDAYKKGNKRGGFGYDKAALPDVNAYAFSTFESDSAREALLLVGSSGPMWLFLNGKEVYSFNVDPGRPFEPDTDAVRVKLVKGTNRLLVFCYQGIGLWSFSVQVSEPGRRFFAKPGVRLKPDALRQFALNQTGDVARGKRIFFDPKGVGCVKCHKVAGAGDGAPVGPDLAGLALRYDRQEIITSILQPSKRLATGFQPLVVVTLEGKVLTGLLRTESKTGLTLVDAQAKLINVNKEDIDDRRLSNRSLMPDNLVEHLKEQDFADLVSYLASLRQPARKE